MRRTGLSYNAKVQPLLKHRPKRPEPELDAPPLSTDDESEGEDVGISLTHRSSPKKGSWLTDMVPGSSSDIEGDERHRKASIAPTKFGSKQPSPDAQSYGTRKKFKRARLSDDESKVMKSKVKASELKRPAASSSAKHLKDEHGFITTKSAKSTYGKRKAGSSEPLSSQTEKPRLRRPPSPLISPQRPTQTFRAPSQDMLSSPPEEKQSLNLANLDDILDSDPENDISEEVQAILRAKSTAKPKELRSKKAKAKSRRDALRSPSPPPAVFKLPTFRDNNGDEENEYISSEEEKPETDSEPEVTKPATCPWCGAEVDRSLLESFSEGKSRLTVQLQTKFCKKHKTRSAKEEWKTKGYPDIDWRNLERRFEKHRDCLLDIINGGTSHYRSIMADLVKSGKSRVLKQEDDLNPGYYGPRGFNIMSDYLVLEFRDELKERAIDDRVISGRGSAAFIQFVLVAELSTRLIMDDMGLDEEEARELMENTKEIGIILHEDG